MKRSIFAVFLCAAILTLTGCAGSQSFSSSSYAMGTFVRATVYAEQDRSSDIFAAVSAADREVLSWRTQGSQTYELNRTGRLSPDKQAYSYIEQCLDISEKSNGAFDITILPISRLWDFGGDNQRLPDSSEIEEAMQFIGFENVSLTPNGISMPTGFAVDFGAVGKGIACDVARDACKETGAEAAVVSVGGSVMLYGDKPGGDKWKVTVRDPDGSVNDSMAILELPGGLCISTSGSYEKTFEQDGETYHHILDPETGYPVESGLKSVTIAHESGLVSDALSTACFSLGIERGMELAENYGAMALFVTGDNRVFVNRSFKDSVELTGQNYTLDIYN